MTLPETIALSCEIVVADPVNAVAQPELAAAARIARAVRVRFPIGGRYP